MDRPRWNAPVVVCYTFIWVFILQGCHCQDNSKKFCFGGREDSPPVDVTLTCEPGKVISLGEVWLVRNQYGLCTYVDGDCKGTTDILGTCEGRENCTLTLEKVYSPDCGWATVMIVSFDCQTAKVTRPTTQPTTPGKPAGSGDPIYTGGNRQIPTSEGENREEDNAGLIAGCVVAVVVTVVLLIVAIVMVVRRLACAPENAEEGEEKKPSGCHILPCVGQNSPADGTKPPQDDISDPDSTHDGTEDSKNKSKRKNRARRADKNQNMSARLAPVGQEDVEEGASSNTGPSSVVNSDQSSSPSSTVVEASGALNKGVGGVGSPPVGGEPPSSAPLFKGGMEGPVKGHSQHRASGEFPTKGHVQQHRGSGGESGTKGHMQQNRASGEFHTKGHTQHNRASGGDFATKGNPPYRASGEFTTDKNSGSAGNIAHPKTKMPAKTVPATAGGNKGVTATSAGKKTPRLDAVAVPNTETTTSC